MGRSDGREKLRVLYLITDLGKGGAERFLVDLCTALDAREDVEFVIGTLFDDNRYGEYTRGMPVVQLHYTPSSLRGEHVYPEYRRLLDDFRPHVVHTHRFLAEFLSAHHVSKDVAYVCHAHDNMVQLLPFRWDTLTSKVALTNWLERRYLIRHKYQRVPTVFVANSAHTRDYFVSVLPGFMRQDVHLLPLGFDYQRFRGPEPRIPDAGQRLKLVNVGSFQDKKNQIFIVEIARGLREAGIDFEINLLGDGANRARVQEAVNRAKLEDRVLLHGNVDRVEEWLWRSHVYLHTATYEPFGLVLLEAMAAGLPCITLDGKGNRELIEQGRNGYLIDAQDASEFVARIQELSTSRDRYEAMARYGQEYAREFDIPEAAARFVGFYRDLIE